MKIVVTLCFVSVGLFFQTELDAQNWSQVSKVIANDRAQEDLFGFYVSLDGNRAVIGAPQEDEDANGGNFLSMAGAAYVFSKDTNGHWLQTQKLVASDRDAFSFFGEAVAMNGNQLLIGSPREQKDANGNNPITTAGAVYVFER
ncbi:MAG: FG-GAP repeat protein [Flavobacteriaceae bacterium]